MAKESTTKTALENEKSGGKVADGKPLEDYQNFELAPVITPPAVKPQGYKRNQAAGEEN